MAGTKRKLGLRWAVTAVVVMLLGALIGLSISLMRSPAPIHKETVVKSLPPAPPPEVKDFLEAEEKDLDVIYQAQNEALDMMMGERDQEAERQPRSQMTMPEVIEAESDLPASDQPSAASPSSQEITPPSQAALPKPPDQPAASTPPAEEVTPADESSEFAFTIHLESFRNSRIAQKRQKQIVQMGLESFMIKVDLPQKGVFHRLFVGKFPDRSQAESLQARLKEDYGLPEGRIMAASRITR